MVSTKYINKTFDFGQMKGSPIYAGAKLLQPIEIYYYDAKNKKWILSKKRIYKGEFIGNLLDVKIDSSKVIPNQPATLKNVTLWLIFKDKLIFGFPYKPKGNQVDFEKLSKFVKSNETLIEENKIKYDKSMFEGAANAIKKTFFSKPFLIAATLLTLAILYKNNSHA